MVPVSGAPIDVGRESFEQAFGQLGCPLHWPSLSPAETDAALDEMAQWVESLVLRFAIEPRIIPPCWAKHRAMVEILSALRDHERASYAETAALTAPMDWMRALHDANVMLADATAKTQCSLGEHRDGLLHSWATVSDGDPRAPLSS